MNEKSADSSYYYERKKFVPNKKGDIGMEAPPHLCHCLDALNGKANGNDIGVGVPPFLCPLFYSERIFCAHLFAFFFVCPLVK